MLSEGTPLYGAGSDGSLPYSKAKTLNRYHELYSLPATSFARWLYVNFFCPPPALDCGSELDQWFFHQPWFFPRSTLGAIEQGKGGGCGTNYC